MTLDELLQAKRDKILEIATSYGAHNVRVFGSVARGEAGPDSDVDLLVELREDWSLLDHIGMVQDLEDLLGRKVDVAVEKQLRSVFRGHVLSEAVPL